MWYMYRSNLTQFINTTTGFSSQITGFSWNKLSPFCSCYTENQWNISQWCYSIFWRKTTSTLIDADDNNSNISNNRIWWLPSINESWWVKFRLQSKRISSIKSSEFVFVMSLIPYWFFSLSLIVCQRRHRSSFRRRTDGLLMMIIKIERDRQLSILFKCSVILSSSLTYVQKPLLSISCFCYSVLFLFLLILHLSHFVSFLVKSYQFVRIRFDDVFAQVNRQMTVTLIDKLNNNINKYLIPMA